MFVQVSFPERQTDKEDAEDVDEQEGAATVLSRYIGKAPDISEADRAADGREDEPVAAGPLFTTRIHGGGKARVVPG